jgi:hypothetical protein
VARSVAVPCSLWSFCQKNHFMAGKRAQFIFDVGAKRRRARIARRCRLSVTAVIEQRSAQVAGEIAQTKEHEAKKTIIARYRRNA